MTALIYIEVLILGPVFLICAKERDCVALPEGQQTPVEVQERAGVVLLHFDVYLLIVRVHAEPRLGGAEAGVFSVRPLHGRARVLARRALDELQDRLLRKELRCDAGDVEGRHILIHIEPRQGDIRHADLLPLIDKGRAALENVHGGEHLPALVMVLLAAVAADDARMVMVLDVQSVPAAPFELELPIGEGLFHLHKIEFGREDFVIKAVRLHVREGDHLIEHVLRPLGDIAERDIRRGHRAFADDEAVIITEHIALKFLEVGVYLRTVGVILHAVCRGELRVSVRQAGSLGDEGDNILAEAVDAHVQPEAQDLFDLLAHGGIIHIEIRLFFCEQMQIKFV